MPKTPVSKGSGILLQQILDMTESLEVMKEAVNHDYSSGEPNISLKKAYDMFLKRKYAFRTQKSKLKQALTDKDYQDIENLISGNLDEVKDKTALLNRYSSPAYKGAVKGWSDISKAELNTVINDDYKLQGVNGVKFTKSNKYISAMKERLVNPIPLGKRKVTIIEPSKKADDGKDQKLAPKQKKQGGKIVPKATGGAKANVDEEFYFDGTQSAEEIQALSRKQKDLITELFKVYEEQENPENIYSKEYADLRKDPRFKGIDINMVEKMIMLPGFKEDTIKGVFRKKELLRKVGEVKQAQADRKEIKAVLESLVSGVEVKDVLESLVSGVEGKQEQVDEKEVKAVLESLVSGVEGKQEQADKKEVKAVLESLVSGVEGKQAQADRIEEVKAVLESLVEGVEMTIDDVDAPEVVKDPDAPYLSVGTEDLDPKEALRKKLASQPQTEEEAMALEELRKKTSDSSADTPKTKITISTSNTKHQDGANSEFTLGDSTQEGGGSSGYVFDTLNTPKGNPPDSDPYSNPVDVGAMDIEELRKRLAAQPQPEKEINKVIKTGVFSSIKKGFGSVNEEIEEEVSRTSGEIPTTPQQAVNMPTGNEVEEEKARNKKDIERLKEEIRGLHKTFGMLIPALREKTHQLRFKLAMMSKDKKVVMKHHAEMMERVRLYFGGGQGNSLKVGVVVPLDSYMSSFFSGVNNGEGDISNITKQTQPKGEHHSRGSGGKVVAKSIYYQRGGMSAVKGQAVSGHQVPSTIIKTRRGKIADPLQVVDAPYEYVLNRKGTGSTKAVSGLKIKSKK